jgi:hypothetical protein
MLSRASNGCLLVRIEKDDSLANYNESIAHGHINAVATTVSRILFLDSYVSNVNILSLWDRMYKNFRPGRCGVLISGISDKEFGAPI